MGKITSYKGLHTWQVAHQLVLFVYKVTRSFPKEEVYGLVSQMRRAAISVSSNVAEGFGRETSKDKLHFYSMARGSLIELDNQFTIAADLSYIDKNKLSEASELVLSVHRLLNGMRKYVRQN